MDTTIIWISGDSGDGKTTLSDMLGLDREVLRTDFIYIDNQNIIKRNYPGVAACWLHDYDIMFNEQIIGNKGIGQFLFNTEERGLTREVVDIILILYPFLDPVVWMEGWMPEKTRTAVIGAFKNANYRVWEVSKV